MARDFAVGFYHSGAWKRTQAAYMARPVYVHGDLCPPYMCERCFGRGILRSAEIVHHKTHIEPWNIDDPHVTLDFGNLMRVCRDCHAVLHGKSDDECPGSRVKFGPNGEVLQR